MRNDWAHNKICDLCFNQIDENICYNCIFSSEYADCDEPHSRFRDMFKKRSDVLNE